MTSVEIEHIIKLNFAGSGYKVLGPRSVDPHLSNVLERTFPQPRYFELYSNLGECRRSALPLMPCVSFSCSLLPTERMVLLLVGCHWVNYPDETGRPGLSMWHGLLLRDVDHSKETVQREVGEHLFKLTYVYTEYFNVAGKRVVELAAQKNGSSMDEAYQFFVQQYSKVPATLNEVTSLIIKSAIAPLKKITPPYNLLVDQPFSPLVAIPLLVEAGLSNNLNVGGGLMDIRDLANYPCISTVKRITSHDTVTLSELLSESLKGKKTNIQRLFRAKETTSVSEKAISDVALQGTASVHALEKRLRATLYLAVGLVLALFILILLIITSTKIKV